MKYLITALLSFAIARSVCAEELHLGGVQLFCHRTANEDVPENTLESLEEAALLGCNVVEIDLRRTLDGEIVLNHDGILERLTDGTGDVKTSLYGDLQMRDFGSWMGERFSGFRVVRFEDALRAARNLNVRLILDIKDKGIGTDVLRILEREGMLERVQFNGEWEDVKGLDRGAASAGDGTVWVEPGVTSAQVKEYHREDKTVVANFSANGYEMDLEAMRAAVANGVDGINVDYPRLGADAVGRPVENRIRQLMMKAASGDSEPRVSAILTLARFRGFPLQEQFAHWLGDKDEHVSRAAAVALVEARPHPGLSIFAAVLLSGSASAKANTAWALGFLNAPASALTPLLKDNDPVVLQSALLALGRLSGDVSKDTLLALLRHSDSRVRAAAAIAMAKHHPETAIVAVADQLKKEISAERVLYDEHTAQGKGDHFSQPEIDAIMQSFRCQMVMMRAITMVDTEAATEQLLSLALRPEKDYSQFDSIIAGFQLWDRIGSDDAKLVEALGSSDRTIADRAEWVLAKAGPAVLASVRNVMKSGDASVRRRAIHILAWQGDSGAIEELESVQKMNGPDAELAGWAIDRIRLLHPQH
jgi:glycerophosphoryl diester phosphodiesterase